MWVSIYLTCLLNTDSVLCIVLDDWTEYKAQFNGVGNKSFTFYLVTTWIFHKEYFTGRLKETTQWRA